ncbi:ABC transporter ATP-binding protein [Nocardia callitridis]|uniref:ABC transporter ATP-binding protein n=1 Tax=Nocardia callitridis TaxID=648753 RepID=A0ABP9KDU9_9NOCA
MIQIPEGVAGAATAARLRRCYGLIVGSALLEGLCFAVLVPLLSALIEQRFPAAWWWAATLAVLLVVAVGANRTASARQRAVSGETVADLQHRLAAHAVRLPLGWFSPASADALTRLTGDAARMLAAALNGVVAVNIRAATWAVVVLLTLLVLDPTTGLVAAAGLAVLVVLHFVAARLLRGATATGNTVTERINGELVEFAQHQAVLRSCGQTARANTEVLDALRRARAASAAYFRGAIIGAVAFQLGTALLVAAVLLTVLVRTDGSGLGVPSAVCATVLAAMLTDSVAALGRTGSVIWAAERTLAEVAAIIATPALAEPDVAPVPTDSSIALRGVAFGYESGRRVLEDISFDVPQGSICAIVGPSGSGKTTLARLVARFWEVESGSITLGGTDIRELRAADLLSRISMVFQDVYLFDATIRENVLLAKPDATPGQLAEAAALARVDEIVARLPQGWDTPVGEVGSALSGGERQRISLARALLKDAPVVLLDEATSALDTENETAIRAATATLTEGRTVLVIAHRLDTVRAADRIVFVEDGRVAETGTHTELLALDGRYASFWNEQNRAQRWQIRAGAGT